jgi:hypothetical protein
MLTLALVFVIRVATLDGPQTKGVCCFVTGGQAVVYAAQHLSAAIELAKVGSFNEAEIELGVGLHALQDVFAHGQITTAMHAVIGEFPDEVDLHPLALYEATLATAAYLVAYLEAITQPARAEAP